jgi:hypothetical protein
MDTGEPPSDPPDSHPSLLTLPEGMTEQEWNREMGRWQNPRIRCILWCLRKLSDVLESNFAILHCSPARIRGIQESVAEVAERLRSEGVPLFAEQSLIPELDASRQAVAVNLAHIDTTVLAPFDEFPEQLPEQDDEELRKFLCGAVGQLNAFLQDSFGSLMAADPRAHRDADYYLSKEFPRDVEESEWLYTSVLRLSELSRGFQKQRRELFPTVMESISGRRRLPEPQQWSTFEAFLRELSGGFITELRKVLAIRAIRLTELELLSHHASEIPITCRVLLELYELGRQSIASLSFAHAKPDEAEQTRLADEAVLHRAATTRIVPHVKALDDSLCDLWAFLPIWRRGISQRRALMFRAPPESTTD